MKKNILTLAIGLLYGYATYADTLNYDKMAPHPHLVFTQGMEASIQKTIDEHEPMRAAHKRIMDFADFTLPEPTSFFQKEGYCILGISRLTLKRITHL